jgi:hypothetical protein
MQDEQLDIFGGSTMVTRKLNRKAPAEVFVQAPLFATDESEFEGQGTLADELATVEESGTLFDVAPVEKAPAAAAPKLTPAMKLALEEIAACGPDGAHRNRWHRATVAALIVAGAVETKWAGHRFQYIRAAAN